jgi:hypothetical protein
MKNPPPHGEGLNTLDPILGISQLQLMPNAMPGYLYATFCSMATIYHAYILAIMHRKVKSKIY